MNLPIQRPQSQPLFIKQQVNLREILAVVLRRRFIILAIAVPIILIATIGTIRSTDVVVASSRVMVEAAQPENPQFYERVVNYDVLMASAAQVSMSIPVARKAAVTMMDSLPKFIARNPLFARIQSVQDMAGVLADGVIGTQVGESNILRVSFRHSEPLFALMACGALLDAYMSYNIESQQRTKAIDYYSDQINAVQVEVDSMMDIKARLREEAGLAALQVNAQQGITQIMVLEQKYYEFRSRRVGLESQLQGLLNAIEEDPDYVPGIRAGESLNMKPMKDNLDKAVIEMAQLRVKYNDDSHFVVRQKELIDRARQNLYRERERFMEDLRIQLKEAREKEETMRVAVAGLRADLQSFPEFEGQIKSLEMQIASRADLLESLQMKQGEVRLKAWTDYRIGNIIPLDEPRINMRVGGSKKILYLLLAAIFAMVLGFLSALFIENQDHRIFQISQAEQALQIPVLGAISTAKLKS